MSDNIWIKVPRWVLRLTGKRIVAFSFLAIVLIAAALVLRVWYSAHAALDAGRQAAQNANKIEARVIRWHPSATRFETVGTAASFRSAVVFEGDLYVTNNSTLFAYRDGNLTKLWHVGLELPPYPLVSLLVRTGIGNPELWIATNGGGILIFDGSTVRQILPEAPGLRKISAMLSLANGQVLVGTPTEGIYVADDKKSRIFHPQFAKTQVTALAGDEDQIWIGTRSDGAWYWSAGEAVHLLAELPDPEVLSITSRGQVAWVGTPLGVAEFSSGRMTRHLGNGVFAHAMAEHDGTLWVGTMDQGTVSIPLATKTSRPQATEGRRDSGSATAFLNIGSDLLGISPDRIWKVTSGETLVTAPALSLASEHVTALHEDSHKRLWIGYFDRGADLVEPPGSGRRIHFEDDTLFCVNRIKENPEDGTIAVATANGLALFDSSGKLRQVLDQRSGLIASHVTDVLFRPSEEAGSFLTVATPAGLSFIDHGSISSIYAFHGLVNNHIYTLAELGGTSYVGTLGGVSVLKSGLIQASFTTANSELRQNWITASAIFEGRLFLGTYGSGVVRFDASGTVTAYPAFANKRIEISPNAMLTTPRALYAGTADHGLAVLRHGEERWQFIQDGLPSADVTALAERDGRLYVGTNNGVVRILEENLLP